MSATCWKGLKSVHHLTQEKRSNQDFQDPQSELWISNPPLRAKSYWIDSNGFTSSTESNESKTSPNFTKRRHCLSAGILRAKVSVGTRCIFIFRSDPQSIIVTSSPCWNPDHSGKFPSNNVWKGFLSSRRRAQPNVSLWYVFGYELSGTFND